MSDEELWRDHFVKPIALQMRQRGIVELNIKLEGTKAAFELIPVKEEQEDRELYAASFLAVARDGDHALAMAEELLAMRKGAKP